MKLIFWKISGSVFSGLDSDRGGNVLDVDGQNAGGGDGLKEGGDEPAGEGMSQLGRG